MDQRSFFGLAEQLEALSRHGDPLEVLDATVDFEYFRTGLVEGLGYGDGSKGGRPPFDPVSMFKALILQAQHNLSDARMEFMIRDRLSWMRFLGFDLGAPTPDENTIRLYRDKLGEFHREAQHRGRMMYPSVWKRRTVSPCQDIPISRPRRETGSPV